ncbi:MAG: hypothetical protein M1836_008169 [Candelina mexicana]|nr:MAG: hypothetical protein M1836_008169 [Candelina mexicana]
MPVVTSPRDLGIDNTDGETDSGTGTSGMVIESDEEEEKPLMYYAKGKYREKVETDDERDSDTSHVSDLDSGSEDFGAFSLQDLRYNYSSHTRTPVDDKSLENQGSSSRPCRSVWAQQQETNSVSIVGQGVGTSFIPSSSVTAHQDPSIYQSPIEKNTAIPLAQGINDDRDQDKDTFPTTKTIPHLQDTMRPPGVSNRVLFKLHDKYVEETDKSKKNDIIVDMLMYLSKGHAQAESYQPLRLAILRSFRPPYDLGAWEHAMHDLEDEADTHVAAWERKNA